MTLTLSEVAALLRCSKAHVSHLVSGKCRGMIPLPAIRLGRRALVRKVALEAWLASLEALSPAGLCPIGPSHATLRSPESIAGKRMKG